MARSKKTGGVKRGKPAARAKVGARAKPAGRAKARPGTSRKKARSGGDDVASLEALARRIVRATSLPSFSFRDLYTEDCMSEEATGDVVRGIAGLEEKLARWEQMQSGTKWRARNVWCKGDTICIEWDATVQLRDGRSVALREIGVHEIRDGRIAAERFYYNPLQLAPPA